LFGYGSRAGIWRLVRLFDAVKIPLTFFATGQALQLNPALCDYLKSSSHEVAGHGWRWVDYSAFSKKEEKIHIEECINKIQILTGKKPKGWYTGRRSEHTRELLLKIGGFLYDSDSYADDYPYFEDQHLIIPYTLVCNDFRYTTSPGFNNPVDFLETLKRTLAYLYEENRSTLMTIGLHARLSGHPGRCGVLQEFINYMQQYKNIWIARRMDIATHWIKYESHR
jgi:peptidoglycan/xylan/chitin deacetylase (PgdA/CDA1 family)